MQGLRIDTPRPRAFSTVFASLLKQIEGRFWFIEAQSGPFVISDLITGKTDSEELLETSRVCVPEFKNGSQTLWKPAIFPLLRDYLLVDEWMYLIGLNGQQGDAVENARRFSHQRWLSREFFDLLASGDSLFLMYVDGWWEAYCTVKRLMSPLSKLPNVSRVDSCRWSDDVGK